VRDLREVACGALTIRRLTPVDAAQLEAHCLRLEPHDALNLFGARAVPIAVRRYLSGIDFLQDIIVGCVEGGIVRATAHIRVDPGCRWAELLLARERSHVVATDWREMIHTGVHLARYASIGWLSVASLGYDPDTREALQALGFNLHAEEEGTIGELCLARVRNLK